MAGPLIRIAAGAGAFVAIVTAGGVGIAVSAADPGGSSHSRHDGRSDARGGEHRGRSHEASNGDRRGTSDSGGHEGRGGSKGQGSPTPIVTSRTAPSVSDTDTDPDTDTDTDTDTDPDPDTVSTSQVSTDQAAASALPELPAAVERDGSTAFDDADRAPTVAPRVTVGNGRSPGVSSGGPEEGPAQVVPSSDVAVALPVAPPIALPPAPVQSSEPPRPETPETPVASSWGTLNPGWPAGALFGIAGLFLAPIAGVWLGHRQARAVKAASQLVRS